MTCSDFERKFNELIDSENATAQSAGSAASGPPAIAADLMRALLDHADRCSSCQEIAARYQILRRALCAWNSPPVVPADLADHILAAQADREARAASAWAVVGEKRERWWPLVLTYGSIMAAAMVIGLVLSAVNMSMRQEQPNRPIPRVTLGGPADQLHSVGGSAPAPLAKSRVLNEALAEATSATLDLARVASEPAARISRQMLDAASQSEGGLGETAIGGGAARAQVTMPALRSLAPDPSAAGAVLQEVGDRLASGMVPLSRTRATPSAFCSSQRPPKSIAAIESQRQRGPDATIC